MESGYLAKLATLYSKPARLSGADKCDPGQQLDFGAAG